jgi:leukotriene-A4 hydrolase
MTALYSGILKTKSSDGEFNTFEYVQDIPVPTYLICIAAGNLEYRFISSRCGVWSEPELAAQSQKEFEDTEVFIKTAEDYLTPYEWKTYDLLVLPPGFGYGGMENPNLTFVTPSLLAGDKSLVNVIAHEIAHSWTGNLVTNKNWQNFWVNEGFTMFLERKIIELVYGRDMFLVEAYEGYQELIKTVEQIGPEHSFTSLTPDLTDVNIC